MLWNQEYPEKLKYHNLSELDNYLNDLSNQKHFLLTNNANEISGWATTFVRENERWFAMILDSSIQDPGYGTLLLNKLKCSAIKLCGWVIDHDLDKKVNGEYYNSPLNFYLKNKFIITPSSRLKSDKISAVKIKWVK